MFSSPVGCIIIDNCLTVYGLNSSSDCCRFVNRKVQNKGTNIFCARKQTAVFLASFSGFIDLKQLIVHEHNSFLHSLKKRIPTITAQIRPKKIYNLI